MDIRASGAKTSETTARLLLVNDGSQAWLEPISWKPNCDLILSGQGEDGRVLVDDSPVLTVASLGNIDELAAVLAGITIEGADPAAVLALETTLKDLLAGLAKKPGATAAEAVKAVYDAISVAGNPPAGASWDQYILNTIMLSCGLDLSGQGQFVNTAVNSINTWTGIDLSSPGNLIASLELTALGTGAGTIDEAAVAAIVEAAITNNTPGIIQAVVDYLEAEGVTAGLPDDINDVIAQIVLTVFDDQAAGLAQAVVDYLSTLPTGALTAEQAAAITDAATLAQGVVNILGGKPGGGGTLTDVATVFGNLGNTFQTQIDESVADILTDFQALIDAIAGSPGATVADVQQMFGMMAQAIGEAINSWAKAMPDKITLNVKSNLAADKVTIEAWQLTPHPPTETRSVDVDFAPYGEGNLTVRGKRVLTEEDALNASGIDQAAIDAAIDIATADLRGEIGVLRNEIMELRAYIDEQFGNFNDLHQQTQTETAQVVLAEQKKLQDVMDVFGGKKNSAVSDVTAGWNSMADYISAVEQQFNQTVNEIVEYLITEYATKTDVEGADQQLAATTAALMQALGGNTPAEVAANFTEFTDRVGEAIQQGIEDKIPDILTALQTHLENVLAIFGGGGTTGVTPAQITELVAEIARVYATKTELARYAKLDDGNQEINAALVKARGIQFTISDEVLVPIDWDDYGNRLSLIPSTAVNLDDAGIVVMHTDLADLVPGAATSRTVEVPELLAAPENRMARTDPLPRVTMDEVQKDQVNQMVVYSITGGRPVPDDVNWTTCPLAGSGVGLVEFRCINGTVQFRGTLKVSVSAVGSNTLVRRIPAGYQFYHPSIAVNLPAYAVDTGTAYRIAMVRIGTDGTIQVSAPTGKYDTIELDGLSYQVF